MQRLKTYVIIVTYNGGKWISDCIKSTSPYPVIVVDNCSTDETREIIKSNFPNVVLLEQNVNLGFGRANNLGISYALMQNADFVFLLNQDAFVKLDTIEQLVRIAEKKKSYGILSPVHLNGTGDFLDKSFLYYLKNQGNNELLTDLMLNNSKKDIYEFKMINAAGWLLPRNTLEKIGGFSPLFFMYGEDVNYVQRLHYHNLKIGVCPSASIIHDSNNNYHPEFEPGTWEYFEKFKIRTKITYANVNTCNNRIDFLKILFLKKIVKSAMKLDRKNLIINIRKYKIVKNMDFTAEVQKERMEGPTHLPKDYSHGKFKK